MPENDDQLERVIHAALRNLPARPAPSTLERRVLAELARGASRPWWRKSFVHWPVPARAGFVVLSAGVAKLVLMATVWALAGFDQVALRAVFTGPVIWVENSLAVAQGITGFCEVMLRNVPPLWLYSGIGFVVTLYSALLGLGAAAYKALHVRP